MSRRVVLHIGAPKAGTTHVQSRLHRNHAALLEHGVLVPRARPEEGPTTLAYRAALELAGVRLGRPATFVEGRWQRLVDLTRAHDGTTVISDEAFVRVRDGTVAWVVGELADDPRELHVVYTARDLARQLVSGWLEGLKHGQQLSLSAYVARARAGDLRPMRAYDLESVLGRWRDAIVAAGGQANQVHLVTLPPEGGDRRLLWRRFCQVAGLPRGSTPASAPRSNDALGLAEAQFLRALNERLGPDAARWGRLHRPVQDVVVAGALAGRSSERVRLGPQEASWVGPLTSRWLAWVRRSGVHVVGDLGELRSRWDAPRAWVDPDVPVAGSVAAADAALAAVVAARRRRQ